MAGGGIDAAPPVQGVIFDLDGACRACKQQGPQPAHQALKQLVVLFPGTILDTGRAAAAPRSLCDGELGGWREQPGAPCCHTLCREPVHLRVKASRGSLWQDPDC